MGDITQIGQDNGIYINLNLDDEWMKRLETEGGGITTDGFHLERRYIQSLELQGFIHIHIYISQITYSQPPSF